MDSQDSLEELATELFGKGKRWDFLHLAAGSALVGYFAWAGALVLGLCKVSVQVTSLPPFDFFFKSRMRRNILC